MDKNEIKKNVKVLDLQVKSMFEMIMNKFEENDITDAMFARKPLGGWSCASC